MNIFDPLISGSLSVSGSGEISGDLTVLGTINGNISGTTTNAISASHAAAYLLTSSFGAFTSSYTTGSFTGSFGGDGSNLINIPASGVTGLNLTRIADGSVTASVSSASGLRVNSNTEITGALTISGSITLNGVPVGTGKLDEIVFNAYSSSNDTTNSLQNGRLDALEGSTSSLNTFTSSATSRLNTIETTTGSLNTFTSSASDKLIYLESTTSSLNTFTSSANGRLNSLETASGSIITDLNSYTSSNNTVIGTIQTTTSSLNSFTSSANGRLSSLESTTSSLNSYTSSNNNRLGVIETTTGSLNSFTSSASGRLSSLEASSGSIRTDFNTYTSSNDSTNSTQNGKLSALETSSGSLNSFTTSINSKIGSIEISTSSLNSFTSSINTTIKNKLDSDNVISGSIQVSITGTSGFTSFSSSIAAIDSAQDVRLTSIEGITGSYATTGSNIFQGNQVITGSLFVSQDLIIAGSSSIQNISSSVLNIADNIITVNALNPSVRFGGLAVIDSGSSPQVSGSILFDSVNNQWLFVHQNQGTLTSSVLLMGPETYNNIGNETYVTANRLVKSTGIEHLTDSNISDNGTTVTILSNAVVNGTFSATGTTLVSGSSQIDHNALTNYVANRHIDHSSVSISTGAGSGLTGGGDITTTRDLSIATGGVTNAMLAGSIENGKLSNSSLTIGSTAISLGGSSATLGGLTSVTSTAFTGSLQGSISGNAATVTTNANLTGVVTSTGNATTIANGNITNVMLAGSIANDKLVNSSFHIGTTSISLGRGSAVQSLTGVSIDGNAGTVTNGVYTTGDQSIAGTKTFTGTINVTASEGREITTFMPASYTTSELVSGHEYGWYNDHWRLGMTRSGGAAGEDFVIQWNAARRLSLTSGGNLTVTGTIGATNLSGTNTGDQTTITGNAGSATILQTARNIGGVSFNGSANIDLPGVNTTGNQNTTGNAATATEVIRTVAAANEANLLYATIADNDYFRIRVGGGSNAGFAEIATADDGTEPIHVRQYSGTFTTLTRTATLLDGSGNTSFPGTVTAPTFSGALSGNASTVTNGVYTTGDQTIGGTKTFSSTIAGSINGNSATVGGFSAAQTYTSTGNAAGSFLGGHYSSGGTEKPNSGTFGAGKFKVAMLSGGNLGFGGSWNDVMWVSTYNGGDVKSSHALVFDKYSSNVWVSDQDFDSASWGTGHLLLHSSNFNSYSPTLTGSGASGTWGINITGNAATLGSISASGFWQAGGSWGADLVSNGFTRQIGVGYVGGEFAILTNNAQISTLIDGSYFAGEQGGFYSMNSANNYSSRVGFNRDGSGNASFNASIVPTTNGTLNLGSSSARWNTIFTSDLSMSNGIGDYTIVEGEEDLFIYNNKTNKVFKFLLQEVDPSIAPAKKVH
jgi:trimeric autotransporter adhesin